MDLLLLRDPTTNGATTGRLFVNGTFFSFTLEDATRAAGVKIPGETAIPFGRYKVIVNKSQRFGRLLPLVLGVDNFTKIRIHAGNDARDTAGCILIGLARVIGQPRILSSQAALDRLLPRIQHALQSEDVWLTISPAPVEDTTIA